MNLRKTAILVCALSLLAGFSLTQTSCNTNDGSSTDKQEENADVQKENSADNLDDSDPEGNSENNPLNEDTNSNDTDGKGVISPGRAN